MLRIWTKPPTQKSCLFFFFWSLCCRLTWKSELSVKNVSSKDYGSYDCLAQNAEGFARHIITLNVTSRPDPPAALR